MSGTYVTDLVAARAEAVIRGAQAKQGGGAPLYLHLEFWVQHVRARLWFSSRRVDDLQPAFPFGFPLAELMICTAGICFRAHEPRALTKSFCWCCAQAPIQDDPQWTALYSHGPSALPDPCRRVTSGMVSHLDAGVGNITEALRETGRWENTILVRVPTFSWR